MLEKGRKAAGKEKEKSWKRKRKKLEKGEKMAGKGKGKESRWKRKRKKVEKKKGRKTAGKGKENG